MKNLKVYQLAESRIVARTSKYENNLMGAIVQVMLKTYIIWGNNDQTPNLITKLKNRDDGVIAVIDQRVKGLRKFKDYVLTAEEYVESLQGTGLHLVHFHYVMDEQEWREVENRELYIWKH